MNDYVCTLCNKWRCLYVIWWMTDVYTSFVEWRCLYVIWWMTLFIRLLLMFVSNLVNDDVCKLFGEWCLYVIWWLTRLHVFWWWTIRLRWRCFYVICWKTMVWCYFEKDYVILTRSQSAPCGCWREWIGLNHF